MTHPNPERLTTDFVTHLATNTAGLDVGDGEAPENPTPAYPYLVVTPLSPFLTTGSLKRGHELEVAEWQVTSVGLTRQQAQGGIGAARDTLIGQTVSFASASYKQTGEVKPVQAPALTSDRSDQPPLFLSNETYQVMVVPV